MAPYLRIRASTGMVPPSQRDNRIPLCPFNQRSRPHLKNLNMPTSRYATQLAGLPHSHSSTHTKARKKQHAVTPAPVTMPMPPPQSQKPDRSTVQIIMLHHCLLKKSEALDFAFELHSPLLMEGKNKEVRPGVKCLPCRELQNQHLV